MEKSLKNPLEPKKLKPSVNLFKKPMSIQYIVLILWIIAVIIEVYYITYESSKLDLVRAGILPIIQDYLVYIGIIIGFLGFLILLFVPDKTH